VVYQNNRNGSWDIFLLDLVSGESTQLTTDLYDDSDVCVIQESGWIAFQNNSTGSERTHLLNVETLEEIPLGSTCENLDQARTILSCEQIGDGLYSWTERVSVNVNDIKVRDTFAGPVVGAWQPGCPVEGVPTCGDGTCSAPSENSDLCPADCACVDDGVCRPGEGSTCRDCIGGELACGVACPEGVCPAGLACSPQGFCWNDTLCASDPPPQDEPEGSGPVSLPPIETLESSQEECVGEDCAYYDESSLTGAAGGGNLAAPLGVGVVLILAGGGLIYLLRRK
jgi:hypothetical protein